MIILNFMIPSFRLPILVVSDPRAKTETQAWLLSMVTADVWRLGRKDGGSAGTVS